MKIGIITFHFPYNCGANLQCYALQTMLTKCGHEVEVINYRPWYHQNRYTRRKHLGTVFAMRYHSKASNHSKMRRLVSAGYKTMRAALDFKLYKDNELSQKLYGGFIEEYLNETKVYRTLEELQKDPPKADLYICGSDQLWNTDITGKTIDPAYFLDFGPEETKRMSYAVGVKMEDIQDEIAGIKRLLKRFQAVSLRESACMEQIRGLLDESTVLRQDVDPTLLLEAEDYFGLIPENSLEDKPFICVYAMGDESQKEVVKIAKELAGRAGVTVVNLAGYKSRFIQEIRDNRVCGPKEFLWYIKNARYVVTNSYHATVFSILFEKEFVCVPHSKTGYRMRELLEKTGLGEKCLSCVEDVSMMTDKWNYEIAREKIAALRETSKVFLEEI